MTILLFISVLALLVEALMEDPLLLPMILQSGLNYLAVISQFLIALVQSRQGPRWLDRLRLRDKA